MIYTKETKKAMKLAYEKHQNQFDKSGLPYIFHPLHLAEQMNDEDSTVVALLHDIVEDTDVTLEDLVNYGFNTNVIEAISTLTHEKGVDYYDYVREISKNEIATKVKIADLKHNSDVTRLDDITEKDKTRLEKYKKCIEFLSNCESIKNSENIKKQKLEEMIAIRDNILESIEEAKTTGTQGIKR